MDADAVILLPAHRAAELDRECRAAGFISELRHGDPDDPIGAVLSLGDEFGNRVDLLLGLRGLGADAYSRAAVIPFQNCQLRVVGREDFIAMNLFAHGPQDLIDAEHALLGLEVPDLELLRKLAAACGAETLAALEHMLAG
jgi:hypothetical protein